MEGYAFSPSAHLTPESALYDPTVGLRLYQAWAPYWDTSRPYLAEKSPLHTVMTRFLQAAFAPQPTYFVFIMRHPFGATQHAWAKHRGLLPRDCGQQLVAHWLRVP